MGGVVEGVEMVVKREMSDECLRVEGVKQKGR